MTSKISTSSQDIQDLYQKALAVRERSYSPYSHCKVGAAIKTSSGKTYIGCNIENASYGATVCAERTAIQSAIADQGSLEIHEIMVVTEATPPWPPCGMCRQVIAEFGKSPKIYLANLKGDFQTLQWQELYPLSFNSSHLKK
jgi:cytidine deaminase